jgi:protein-S-isoprenylcysteine O-methyltransferase Ste14
MKSEIADLVSTRLATPDPSAPASGNSTSPVDTFSIYRPIAVDDAAESPRPSLTKSWSYRHRMQVTAVVLGTAWTYVALSRPWIAQGTALDWIIDGAAWTVFLAGAAVRLWATLWIAGRKKQTVVDDGPYRACRNPLYVGSFVMGIGLGLFLKSLAFAAGLGLVMSLYLWFVVPAEERYMRSRFGAAFDDYCRRVPGWIPRLDLLRRNEVFQRAADQGALLRECGRMACWMLLAVGAELMCHLRGTVWPIW